MSIALKPGLNPCASSPFFPLLFSPSHSLFLSRLGLVVRSCHWVVFTATLADVLAISPRWPRCSSHACYLLFTMLGSTQCKGCVSSTALDFPKCPPLRPSFHLIAKVEWVFGKFSKIKFLMFIFYDQRVMGRYERGFRNLGI